MNAKSRVSAVIGYIPIIGWLYVFLLQRNDELAKYHAKQSIGMVVFVIAVFVAWAVAAYLIALIPMMAVISMGLFSLVIAFWLYCALLLVGGIIRALRNEMEPLPIFGKWAERLPF